MAVSQDELTRMVIAATTGQPYRPATPEQTQAWERIQGEVAAIKARPGAVVDISPDLP